MGEASVAFFGSLSPVASQKSFGIQKISLVAGGKFFEGEASVTFFGSLSPVASQKSFGIQKISLVAGGKFFVGEASVAFFELPLSGCFAKVVRYPKNFTCSWGKNSYAWCRRCIFLGSFPSFARKSRRSFQ
ncbi:hypothetical protein ACFQ3J_08475 [Paenibacillus provencensis]|uniref:Uncharacterized protein n=1 Tax=Paenibacillus provencensis TaxID=441151 RepID=A0ABW3Q1V2_9BACL|nr:hypothetical protein [Paenibacillus sp. MER 78]MCM3129073.1 hypothetical protein [Paenibacillus sp. MER 78]